MRAFTAVCLSALFVCICARSWGPVRDEFDGAGSDTGFGGGDTGFGGGGMGQGTGGTPQWFNAGGHGGPGGHGGSATLSLGANGFQPSRTKRWANWGASRDEGDGAGFGQSGGRPTIGNVAGSGGPGGNGGSASLSFGGPGQAMGQGEPQIVISSKSGSTGGNGGPGWFAISVGEGANQQPWWRDMRERWPF